MANLTVTAGALLACAGMLHFYIYYIVKKSDRIDSCPKQLKKKK